MFRKLAGLTVIAGLFVAGSASAAITDSAHDFRTSLSITEICVVCHAPHANGNTTGTLLWNRVTNEATYTPYSSPTLTGVTADAPGETSMLCLGCHDGAVAVDNYGGVTTGTQVINGTNFGGLVKFDLDLGNDHPIGLTYNPASDGELNPVSTSFGPGAGTVDDFLQAGKVECATCHDVHNTASAANSTLLIEPLANSAICTACHNK